MAQWTYEDLDSAVRRSLLPPENKGMGVLDILNAQGYDIAESQFVDSLSHNLSRGQFLLIIAGDGIRRDVEAMAAYLQSTPNLFFNLSLLELALFRLKRDQDWPLLVQPRIVARTAEVVRAVVEVKSDGTQSVEVTLPKEEEKTGISGRRILSEETFFEELEQLTDRKTSEEVTALLDELYRMGLEPTWRASSVSIRFPDPGTSDKDFTIIIIKTDGSFQIGYLEYIELANYDPSIWQSYYEEVIRISGAKPNKHNNGTRPKDLQFLLNQKQSFLNNVDLLIQQIEKQAQINS
jgi:hypothetical protein